MAIIDSLTPGLQKGLLQQQTGPAKSVGTPTFSETLSNMVDQVDALQKDAGQSVKQFISGEEANLHDVMASMEEAQLSFQFMMEVRNKLLEGYHELMRMQV